MNEVGSESHAGGTVQITGIRELRRKLRATGANLDDLKDLNHRLGLIVIANAAPPRKTGATAASMRAGRGATKAVVRAGYARRASYAGVVHYGDPHRGHRAQPFLTDALKRSQSQIISTLEIGIDQVLAKNDLK